MVQILLKDLLACFKLVDFPALLITWYRKDKLESGISIKWMKKLSMETYTHV